MWQAIKMSVGSYTAHSKVQYTANHAYTYIEKLLCFLHSHVTLSQSPSITLKLYTPRSQMELCVCAWVEYRNLFPCTTNVSR